MNSFKEECGLIIFTFRDRLAQYEEWVGGEVVSVEIEMSRCILKCELN